MKQVFSTYETTQGGNVERSGLLTVGATDRAVMAITELHMRWEENGKKFDDRMIADSALAWSLDDQEYGTLSTFLCEFVMEMREDAESYDED